MSGAYNFDLRLLKNYGLSLNINKKYFIVYCPMTWTIDAVYDNIHDALEDGSDTVEDWHKSCNDARDSQCPHNSKYTQDFVGDNYIFKKGFFQNLSVWDLLEHLDRHINDDSHPDYRTMSTSEREAAKHDAIQYTLSRISGNMQCYPDNALTPYLKI